MNGLIVVQIEKIMEQDSVLLIHNHGELCPASVMRDPIRSKRLGLVFFHFFSIYFTYILGVGFS